MNLSRLHFGKSHVHSDRTIVSKITANLNHDVRRMRSPPNKPEEPAKSNASKPINQQLPSPDQAKATNRRGQEPAIEIGTVVTAISHRDGDRDGDQVEMGTGTKTTPLHLQACRNES